MLPRRQAEVSAIAIDTRAKRQSAARAGSWPSAINPNPDGTIAQADRQHVAGYYGGILATAAAVLLARILAATVTCRTFASATLTCRTFDSATVTVPTFDSATV